MMRRLLAAAFLTLCLASPALADLRGAGFGVGPLTLSGNTPVLLGAYSATTVAAGTGYVPGDALTVTGGTRSAGGASATISVPDTKVVSATVAAGGASCTNGTQTVTGTTGTGTKFQASVTVAGNAITAVNSITVPGDYTVNPTAITVEPVTGASCVGSQLSVVMGVLNAVVTNLGRYSVFPTGTVAVTGGSGSGATFTLNSNVAASGLVFPPFWTGSFHALGTNNMALGDGAGGTFDGVYLNLAIGPHALTLNTTGSENLAVGPLSLHSYTGGAVGTCLSGNVALGINSQALNVSGCDNVSVGTDSLGNMSSASGHNVAIGNAALSTSDIGSNNVGIGYGVGNRGTNGRGNNILIGHNTAFGSLTSAYTKMTVVGDNALGDITLLSPTRDVMLGNDIANGASFSGADNVIVGSSAGTVLTGNAHNLTIIGSLAAFAATTPTSSVIIGDNVANTTFLTATHVLMICTRGGACDGNTSNLVNIENILTVTGTGTPATSAALFAGTLDSTAGYKANGTVGVTCAGSPTAGFASTLGIVTHC